MRILLVGHCKIYGVAGFMCMAIMLGVTGCNKASTSDVVACRFVDADAARCVEFVQLKSPDMRLLATSQCRQNGGTFSDACPTSDLLGICETKNDVSKAWVFSHRSRAFYYGGPGSSAALNVERTKAGCKDGNWIEVKK